MIQLISCEIGPSNERFISSKRGQTIFINMKTIGGIILLNETARIP